MASVVTVVVTAVNRTNRVFAGIQARMAALTASIGRQFNRLTGHSNSLVRALGRVGLAGTNAAQLFLKTFAPIATAGMVTIASSMAATLASFLVAALAPAVLLAAGGGVFALGIAMAAKSAPVKAAFDGFKARAKEAFKDIGGPFQAPLVRAMQAFGAQAEKIAPSINKMVAMAAPHLDQLVTGLMGMVDNAMPGFMKAFEASLPLIDKLAEKLPAIGTAISQFFELVANAGPQATRVFADLVDVLNFIVVALGGTINFAARFYSTMIDFWLGVGSVASSVWNAISSAASSTWNFISSAVSGLRGAVVSAFKGITDMVLGFFGMIINSAAKAFGWIPGLGPKLQAAANDFNNFKNQVNAALAAIDKHVVITVERKFIGGTLGGSGGFRGLRSGGVASAATGGSRSKLTRVGEGGWEFVDFSQGRVYNHEQSKRMEKQQGDGAPAGISIAVSADSGSVGNPFVEAVLELIRTKKIRLTVKGNRVVAA